MLRKRSFDFEDDVPVEVFESLEHLSSEEYEDPTFYWLFVEKPARLRLEETLIDEELKLAIWGDRWGARHTHRNATWATRYRRLKSVKREPIDRMAIYDRDRGICHICRRKVSRSRFTLDHIVAIAAGGEDTPRNVRVAHGRCNSRMHVHALPAQQLLFG